MIAVLAFVGGALVILGQVFPYDFLRDAYRAGEALIIQQQIIDNPVRANLYQEARTKAQGVTVFDRERAADGYVLYTSGDDQVARLIARDGRVVHEWRRPFSEVWTPQAAVTDPQPDTLIYMDKARVFPNGDLLAIYISSADTPWGYGMVKLDRDSNVIWRYLAHAHHDMIVAPDQRIYTLIQEFNYQRPESAPQLDRPYMEDFLAVLSPDGEELDRISLTRAMLESRYRVLFEILPYFSLADPLHPNTVKYIDADTARAFPYAEEGDILVSFRDLSLVAVLSVRQRAITWATQGPWLRQHDPGILPNGDILLFDNFGGLKPGNSSRIIQFDPRRGVVTWEYAGSADRPFHSPIRSNVQRLPNGNTLVTESDGARIFEVTQSGDIVWEYVNPIRRGPQDSLVPVLNGGQRVDPNSLDPEFRSMLEQQVASP